MIYLDHAATTPLDGEVLELYIRELKEDYGNPSSIYRLGKKASRKLRQAREDIAGIFGLGDRNIYFTSGATESNNWALWSQSLAHRRAFGQDEIVTTSLEHPAVVKTLDYLKTLGFKVIEVAPRDGNIQVQDFLDATNEKTCGWICMAVNNETGSILPVTQLGQEAKDRNIYFHIDGVQAMALEEVDLKSTYYTSLTCSGHKVYGPKGMGFLATKNLKAPLMAYHRGGSQEFNLRAGTVDVPGAQALAKALEIAYTRSQEDQAHCQSLKEACIQGLSQEGLDFAVNQLAQESPKILNLWIKGVPAQELLMKLDMEDIYVSAGSACSAGALGPSRVIESIYPQDPNRGLESIRLSFGRENTLEEIDQLVQALVKA